MADPENPTGNNGNPPRLPHPMRQVSLIFNCPEGFEPGNFVICALDAHGNTFSNVPIEQPHLGLHLATKLLDFCSQQAVQYIQQKKAEESPIIPVRGSLPPFRGPVGRG